MTSPRPVSVILDTDMGNDIDDALALVMLHALERAGECRLAGITISKGNPWSVAYTQVVNDRCGRPDIPIGLVRDGATPDEGNFIRKIAEPLSPRLCAEDAVPLLRRLLASCEDHSVVLVTIGFFTNLSRLLESPADRVSDLCGQDLVAAKVRLVCSMAGNFLPVADHASGPDIGNPEFNIRTDIPAAHNFIARCPAPMVFSGFETGAAVLFPGAAIERILAEEPGNPVAAGYAAYIPMPYDRQSWDQTAVLHAVRPDDGYFDLSPAGVVSVDAEGYTRFVPRPDGRHRLLLLPAHKLPLVRDEITRLGTAFPVPVPSAS